MTDQIRLHMGVREWAMLVGLYVLWGGAFFFIDVAVETVPPFTLVFLRVTIAASILLVVLRVTGRPWPFERRTIVPFLTLALLNNVIPFTLFAWGQQQIASGLASILNATTPLWAVLVAHVLTADEKATPLKVAGVAIGFAGVALMIGGDFLLDIGGADLLAQLACLVATLSYALAGVHARRFRLMGVSPIAVSAGALGAAVPVMLVLVLAFEPTSLGTVPSAETVAAIFALAFFSTALAFILYFRLIESAGATNAILVTFLIPVTAILLGATLLGEVLAPRHFIGMALIAAGLALIDGRIFARRRAPTPA